MWERRSRFRSTDLPLCTLIREVSFRGRSNCSSAEPENGVTFGFRVKDGKETDHEAPGPGRSCCNPDPVYAKGDRLHVSVD